MIPTPPNTSGLEGRRRESEDCIWEPVTITPGWQGETVRLVPRVVRHREAPDCEPRVTPLFGPARNASRCDAGRAGHTVYFGIAQRRALPYLSRGSPDSTAAHKTPNL